MTSVWRTVQCRIRTITGAAISVFGFLVILQLGVAGAGNPPPDRDGDGTPGEATAIRERARWYRRHHGLDGDGAAARQLERARWSLERQLAKRRAPAAVDSPGWISIGPVNGAGRAPAVVPHLTVPGTVLAGTSGGGLWRSIDGGASWVPLTDDLPDLSVGSAAFAPSDPDRIYLGTGEGGYAGDFIPGVGLLRSLDGGETWILPDDELASQFFAISVHPDDPDHLVVGTNRGLFESYDAGVTWVERIAADGLVGINEVLRSATEADRLYATAWCISECPPGIDRVMRSDDGGVSWQPAASGLPQVAFANPSRNRMGLALAASNHDILYAGAYTVDDDVQDVGVWASFDGGSSWQPTADPGPYLGQQGWYDNAISIHPSDPSIVVASGVWYVVSHDGGASWTVLDPYEGGSGDGMGTDTIPHVDGHDLQWQGDTLWLACDGGIYRSDDAGLSWSERSANLVTRQYYGLALDPMRDAVMLAGTQDNASNLRSPADDDTWERVIWADGFDCAINPFIPDMMYGSLYRTRVFRNTTAGAGAWTEISPDIGSERGPFATPLTMRDDAPWVLYTGAESVFRSTNAGDSWQPMSTAVIDGVWTSAQVTAIAVSAADPELLMVAKAEAIFVSHDAGANWHLARADRTVNNIGISERDPDLALACLARATDGSDQLLRSRDGGDTWQASGAGLPPFAVHVARWHPTLDDVAYVGTDVGLYVTTDGGDSWNEVGEGMPAASVHDLRIEADGSRLVAATHGRGVWELVLASSENRAPMVELTDGPADGRVKLGEIVGFAARAADQDGDTLRLRWIFGDRWTLIDGGSGAPEVSSAIGHSFERGGQFVIAAHAEDEHGASAVATLTVEAYEPGDDCSTPRVVPGGGPFPVTVLSENRSASRAESDPPPTCVQSNNDAWVGRWGSVWFELTPERSATYVVSTCGSWADTVLSAWTGPTCGPYLPVEGGCNDDDDYVHCTGARTDSYLELELAAGTTYRFMVGGWGEAWTGPFRFNVECAECDQSVPEKVYMVPAAAASAGSQGTQWVTDLSLYNPGHVAAHALLQFQQDGGLSDGVEVSLPVGQALDLEDVVRGGLGAAGSGAIRITASEALLAGSRTFNNAPAGSFGQGIGVREPSAAIAPGGAARLVGLTSNTAFRTNLGLANAGATPVQVEIELFSAMGDQLATRIEELPVDGWRQINRIFEAEALSELDSAYAVVRNRSLDGWFFAYASVVDELSGDPVFVTDAPMVGADELVWLPAAAHTAGVAGAWWQSDIHLANFGAVDSSVRIELLKSGEDNSDPESKTVRVAANSVVTITDVVDSLFGVEGTGALRLAVNQGLVMATSRTYTTNAGGSFGQYIPAAGERSVIDEGEVGVLLQLRADDTYRTNVGMVNLGPQYLAVEIVFHASDGELLGVRNRTLRPFAHLQVNQAVPGANLAWGYAEVRPQSAGGRLLAYASVVDNRSGDPVYIPALVIDD